MPKLKPISRYPLIENIREFFKIQSWMPIIPWIEKNITMVDDVSSESDKPDFSRYCYQLEPLKQWEDIHSRKHVTVVMCEQMGKTSLFVYGILYRLIYDPGSVLVCYPGADNAVETNGTKFIPLMKRLPRPERRASKTKSHKKRPHKALKCSSLLARLRLKDSQQKLLNRLW